MIFDDPSQVEQVCYTMRLADFPRALNRTRINELFNGWPPYSDEEVKSNNIEVNVNFLEGTRIAHEARAQFNQAFRKPGVFFKASTDRAPVHKRSLFGASFTKHVNKVMRKSLPYFETCRSKFASNVLHGIAPGVWRDRKKWCPQSFGVEDILVPANTLLTLENLPFFAVYRTFTGPELIKLTKSSKLDPGWNRPLIDSCIKWIDDQTTVLMGNNWPEIWSPEKASERVKSDGGFYAADGAPTINAWDFYFWNDAGKEYGWSRRMILDSWSTPQVNGGQVSMSRRTGEVWDEARNQFLYNPKGRKWGRTIGQIIGFQFADLSCVSPFRYHSVRSLGFLMFNLCHLQNRLRCKFSEAIFESLLQYFRVKNMDDAERALKVELANRGFIDESLQFIPAQERYQVNAALVELGLRDNQNLMAANSNGYTTSPDKTPEKREKTKFEVEAEVSNMTSLVTAALEQAYTYQSFEYEEIVRRFCLKDTDDVDVISARSACVRDGVPLRLLTDSTAWDIEPERVIGGGNKAMEMAIAQQLMQYRNLYDPEPQREILRDFTLAITDDPGRSMRYVPEAPQVSNTIHDTELVFSALMSGTPVSPKSGLNNVEVVGTMISLMEFKINSIMQQGGVGTPQDVMGLTLCAQYVGGFLQKLSEDPNEKQRVVEASKALSKLMNEVRAMQQRQQEMAQQSQQNGQQIDPKDAAKIQGMMMTAQVKADNMAKSHAQRTAQRQVQWEMEQRRSMIDGRTEADGNSRRLGQELAEERIAAETDLANRNRQAGQDLAIGRLEAEQELRRQAALAQEKTKTEGE